MLAGVENCGHGIRWAQRCIACEILWEREALHFAEQSVTKHTRKLTQLIEEEKHMHAGWKK